MEWFFWLFYLIIYWNIVVFFFCDFGFDGFRDFSVLKKNFFFKEYWKLRLFFIYFGIFFIIELIGIEGG